MDNEQKIISISDKEPTKMEMFDQWLKELIFPGIVKDFIQDVSGSGTGTVITRKICFYTNDNQYFITAIERSDGDDNSYLGCQVTTRKCRAGENWTRGNDLPDGKFTKKTWDMIINAIVNYELVKLSVYQKPDSIPKDIA